MLKKFVRMFGGDPNKREIDKNTEIIEQINSLEAAFDALSDAALREKTGEFRAACSKVRRWTTCFRKPLQPCERRASVPSGCAIMTFR